MTIPLSGLRRFWLGAGAGRGPYELVAFDRALRAAGVADYNLVKISSILPPGAFKAEKLDLPPGSLLPIAYGEFFSGQEGLVISAAVAAGLPKEPNAVGVIMEVAGPLSEDEARAMAEEMARLALEDRGVGVREVLLASASARVQGPTAVFAGVALLP